MDGTALLITYITPCRSVDSTQWHQQLVRHANTAYSLHSSTQG